MWTKESSTRRISLKIVSNYFDNKNRRSETSKAIDAHRGVRVEGKYRTAQDEFQKTC
jgi:hypothetical protein